MSKEPRSASGTDRSAERYRALEARPPAGEAFLLGLQHTLAVFVGIVTPPLIIAGAAGLDAAQTGYFLSMALIMSGVTTFVQCRRIGPLGSGLLGVHGTSFTFVPMALHSVGAGGIPLALGMSLAASPVEALMSRFVRQAPRVFPPIVTGTVVTLIGLSLIEVGIRDFGGGTGAGEQFGSPRNLLLGSVVLLVIILCRRFGRGLLQVGAIAIGLLAGYLAAIPLGMVDFAPVAQAGWFTVARPLYFGLSFDAAHLLPWVLAYFITSIETIGDLTAIAEASGEPVRGPGHRDRLARGLLADSAGSALAAVFNSLPNTTFSQNIGVIQITRVGSRVVGYTVALILLVLGFVPRIGALVSVMPPAVLGGATLALFGMVAVSGIRIAARDGLSDRNLFLFAIALAFGLGVNYRPDIAAQLPGPLATVLSSGVAVGALLAVALNFLLPETPDGEGDSPSS